MKSFFIGATIIIVWLLSTPFINLLNIKFARAENIIVHSIEIIKRQVSGKKNSLRVTQNDEITLNWKTDENVDIHLHGYDIKKTILAGQINKMKFKAKSTGRFPITSHGFKGEKKHSHGKRALFFLEVHPE
jgi:hypothetical protein